jgi:hypothetical protein
LRIPYLKIKQLVFCIFVESSTPIRQEEADASSQTATSSKGTVFD